jgi:hypothetical protein
MYSVHFSAESPNKNKVIKKEKIMHVATSGQQEKH